MSAKLARVLPHAVMLVVACLLYWAATRIEAETGGRIGPAVWPKAVIIFMGLLCAYEIVKRLLVRSEFEATGLVTTDPPPAPSQGEVEQAPASPAGQGMLLGGIALVAAYVFTVPWIGFLTATALFLVVFPWIGGLRRPVSALAIGLAGTLFLAVVFLKVAYISLPLGEGPFRALSLAVMRLLGVT